MKCRGLTSLDNVYLAKVVGVPLTRCLKECVEQRPRDPIEWIAQWLYKYADSSKYFHERAAFTKDLDVFEKDYEEQKRRVKTNIQTLKRKGMGMMMEYGVYVDSKTDGSRRQSSFVIPSTAETPAVDLVKCGTGGTKSATTWSRNPGAKRLAWRTQGDASSSTASERRVRWGDV